MPRLGISPVSFLPHVVISNSHYLSASLILRIPEYIHHPREDVPFQPANVSWEIVEPEAHLRFRWDEHELFKKDCCTDFTGEIRAHGDKVTFEVTMHNVGDRPHNRGVSEFCLQTGAFFGFRDTQGQMTFIRTSDAWARVNEGQRAVHNLIAKVNDVEEWVLAMALDQPNNPGGNRLIWPSCLHTNPRWRQLAPGESETAHGKIYFFRGTLDDVYERYKGDFAGQ